MLVLKAYQKTRKFFYKLLSDNSYSGNPVLIQPLQAIGEGRIIFHENVKIGYFPSLFFLNTYAFLNARKSGVTIEIGKDTWINNNISIISESSGVFIGERCLIGYNVEILDSDFHAISLRDRKSGVKHLSQKVVIGNDVFIGSNVKILKGVTIGDAAVVANSSVVTKVVPAYSIVAGNPARVVRYIT